MSDYPKIQDLDKKIAKKAAQLEENFTLDNVNERVSETLTSFFVAAFPARRHENLLNGEQPDGARVLLTDLVDAVEKTCSPFFVHGGQVRAELLDLACAFLRDVVGLGEEVVAVARKQTEDRERSFDHTTLDQTPQAKTARMA